MSDGARLAQVLRRKGSVADLWTRPDLPFRPVL